MSIRESKESLFSYGNEVTTNHRVSLYVAGVCACLLVLITIVLVSIPQDLYTTSNLNSTSTNPPQLSGSKQQAANAKPQRDKLPCTFLLMEDNGKCKVTCERIGNVDNPGELIVESIQTFYDNNSGDCSKEWSLEIKIVSFPNYKISADWFVVENEENFPEIDTLYIHECPGLEEIESGALEKFPFGVNLISLTLARNKAFKELQAGITEGLTALSTLQLSENGVIGSLDEDFFEPFKSTLQILQVQGGFETPLIMATMLGICQKSFLSSLVLMDLSFNNQGMGLRHLGNHQLSSLVKVQSLFLQVSGIEVIDANAFSSFSSTIKTLNLANNQLITLQNDTFSGMAKEGTSIELYLEGNPWKCDCHLSWLQALLIENGAFSSSDSPKCNSPESERGKLLIDADMSASCPEFEPPPPPLIITCSSMTTTTTTTTNTLTSTTVSGIPMTSTEPPKPPSTSAPEFSCSAFHPHSLREISNTAQKQDKFNISETGNNYWSHTEVVIDTGTGGQGPGKTLVWHKEDEPSCLRGVRGLVVVSNLTRGKAYVFCLYDGEEIESPSQCQGFTTLPEWDARPWILNEEMPKWVTIFAIVAILCALVGAGGVIFAIWQKPTLLALNSRVVKVRTSKTEAVIMPKPPKKIKEQTKEADNVSIRSDPSYVSVARASKVSLFAFRFREWLRKVENGEISPPSQEGTDSHSSATSNCTETSSNGPDFNNRQFCTVVSTVSTDYSQS